MFLNPFYHVGFSLLLFNVRICIAQQPPTNFVNRGINNHQIQLIEGSGCEISLECDGMGQPQPEYRWFKNEIEIDENGGSECENSCIPETQARRSKRSVNAISITCEGYYHCEATNKFGKAKSEVIFISKNLLSNPTGNGDTVPQFTHEPKPELVPYKQSKTLHCAATGNPNPTIIWTRNGIEINSEYQNTHMGQVDLDTATNSLTINSVNDDAVGTYACNATNRAGYDYKSVPVYILNQSPNFLDTPMNKNLSIGMKGTFSCRVGGYPEPTISWTHNNVEIDIQKNIVSQSKYEMTADGSLIISSIGIEDEGSFSCSARNTEGVISGKYV